MLEMFWEMHQQSKINDATSEATQARHTASNAADRIKYLENSIDRLLLVNRAMWELMSERLNLTEDHLMQKVKEVDLRDGTLDGKFNKTVRSRCTACGRTMSSRHGRCLYCGAPDLEADAFDAVK